VHRDNPLSIFDCLCLHRNFKQLHRRRSSSSGSSYNLVNDAHDTDIYFVSQWLQFWLIPLSNFNDNKTLVLLRFDENEISLPA
jgi:hypothetical protein